MPRYNGGFIGTDGLDAPDAPTIDSVTAGDAQVSVAFTDAGGGTSATTSFVVQVSTNDTDYSVGSNTGTSSPIVVTSLTNGTAATAKVWAINAYGTSAPSDASSSFTPALASRMLVAGGEESVSMNTINYDDIVSAGNFSDFGDLTSTLYKGGAVGTPTRVVFGHGGGNVMSYVDPQTTGNSTDFGDLSGTTSEYGSCGNGTYGYFFGGGGYKTVLQYITIASTGNSASFGSLDTGVEKPSGMASQTRAICSGGDDNNVSNTIQYWTIGTSGSVSDFGNLVVAHGNDPGSCSSPTRGITAGGYITIASTGNATDFGDLTANWSYGPSSGSSHITGLFAGGSITGATNNTVEFITIASTGNSQDWGDLNYTVSYHPAGASTRHGGIA